MAVPKRVEARQVEAPAPATRSASSRATAPDKPLQSPTRLAPGLVGTRLRERRLARGISLRQFARDLDVSASFISQLETGKAQPSVATFYSICAALDISIDELFAESESLTATRVNGPTDAENNHWRTDLHPDAKGVVDPAPGNGSSSLVVHPDERRVIVLDSGVTWESLTSTHHDRTDFMYVRYDVGGSSTLEGRLMRHVGTEYGYILRGRLEITVGFETHLVVAGDSISFDSSRPHRLTNVGDEPVEAIWVNLGFDGGAH